jgi:(5-formylfuran-3-yl)methyl phosphate synthase
VAYADARGAIVTLDTVIDLALAAGARGVLVDTSNKRGPGLTSLVEPDRLTAWISRAHAAGLLAAVAGRLSSTDLPAVAASGADVVGVRGAACEGGRLGRVTAQRVAALATRLAATGTASTRG